MVIDPGMLTGTAYLKAVMQEVIWVLYQIVDLWSLQRGSLRVLGLSMVPNYPPHSKCSKKSCWKLCNHFQQKLGTYTTILLSIG
jgi:hypothetical protein